MPRVSLLLLLSALTRASIIPDHPSFSERLGKIYEKLEKFSPKITEPPLPQAKLFDLEPPTTERIDKLYEKLDRLNSLTPDKFLSEDDEELLDAMQEWGELDYEMGAKELQRIKSESDGDYDDEDLDLAEEDYMDDGDELEPEDKEGTTAKTVKFATPSALNRLERIGTAFSTMSAVSTGSAGSPGSTRPGAEATMRERPQVVDREQIAAMAVNSMAATKERPRILDDASMTASERAALTRAARGYLLTMMPRSKCHVPQPRWLPVRQMAPASDTIYRPACVLLHRCASDSGCCHNEEHVCAPVEGQYVTIPLYLRKVDGNTVARMQFFNHTRCACVPQETLHNVPRSPRPNPEAHRQAYLATDKPVSEVQTTDKQTLNVEVEEQRANSLESVGNANQSDFPTQEPKLNTETAAPPQLRRCTCPTLFIARAVDAGCACVCDWPDPQRHRDCLSQSRGREHFSLRDRVCVAEGDCNLPTCEYGAYERNFGRCPLKRYRRRLRFTSRRYLGRDLA